jgi:hypothetical protein
LKLEKIYLSCDSCGISMGAAYETQEFFDVGEVKICGFCNNLLLKKGYIVVDERQNDIVVLFNDGHRETINNKDIHKRLNGDFVRIPSN